MRGFIHEYVRMDRNEATAMGMSFASSRDLGAGVGGSLGSLYTQPKRRKYKTRTVRN